MEINSCIFAVTCNLGSFYFILIYHYAGGTLLLNNTTKVLGVSAPHKLMEAKGYIVR